MAFVLLAVVLATRAHDLAAHAADEVGGGGSFLGGGNIEVEAGIEDAPQNSPESSSSVDAPASGAPTDGSRWLPYPAYDLPPNPDYVHGVEWCRVTLFEYFGPGVSDEDAETRIAILTRAFELDFARHGEVNGWPQEMQDAPCEDDPLDAITVEMAEAAVRDVVADQVPRPEPRIPPGYALTGLPAYLVTEHDLAFGPVTATLDFGVATAEVTMSGSGRSTVDWGDGSVETYEVVGTPYPEGQVTHTYTDRGTVSITVVDTWSVGYDIAGTSLSGTLTAELDPVTLSDFEVREYRAVRVAPEG